MESKKLRLKSKKLESGKYQVGFTTEGIRPNFYGYLLAEPSTPLQEVVAKIKRHVERMANRPRYFQQNLFSLGNRQVNAGKILIFEK